MKKLSVLILMALILALAVDRRLVSQTTPADAPVPAPWIPSDLEAATATGNSRSIGSTFKLTSSGADISGTKDSGHFLHQTVTNDAAIIARILTIAGPGRSAGGGLMIRSSSTPGAPSVFLGITASNGIIFTRRAESGDISEIDAYKALPSIRAQKSFPATARVWSEAATNSISALTAPCWLKLVRHGPDLTAWFSLSGTNWQWIGTERLHLPAEIQIGLAAASGDSRQNCSVTFDQVQLQRLERANVVPRFGNGIGLLGTYTDQVGNRAQRLNATLNFIWARQDPAPGISNQYFTAIWEGFVEPRFTEPYAFSILHDDGVRLWIGDQLIIDDQDKPSVREAKAVLSLNAGVRYPIRLQYSQGHGTAVLKLRWSSPSIPTQIIPRSQLHPPMAFDSLKSGPPAQPFDLSQGLEALQAIDQHPGLAVPWLTRSFRPGTNSGLAQTLDDAIAVTASGSLTGRGVDDGRFVYQPWRGDVQLIARVRHTGLDNATDPADSAAQAGLMIRETLEENSCASFLAVIPRGPTRFFHRLEPGNQTQPLRLPNPRLGPDALNPSSLEQPWIKLMRRGHHFAGYTSADGIGWILLGTVMIPMESDVFIGFALGSGTTNTSSQATFDSIEISQPPTLTPLIGVGDGLTAAYFDGLGSNSVLQIDPQINFSWGNRPPAEGIPSSDFRVRWEGLLEAQFSETYTLHLINDGSFRLWFDGQPLLRGVNGPREHERTVQLSLLAGHRYSIKLEYIHQHQTGGSGTPAARIARLLWSSPGTSKTPIPQTQLYSSQNAAYTAIPDKDRDQLPDQWETRHGLDPFDASDAGADPDNDSLTNLREFQAGTNPRNSDTDGDGLPDAWELRHHLNPLNPSDAQRDYDHDHLTNLGEFHAGTAPDNSDSDADGLQDDLELNEINTNPLVADTTGTLTVTEVAGANSVRQLGRWQVEQQSITALDIRGSVEYDLSAPAGDIYRLEIEAGAAKAHDRNRQFDLLLWIDGQYLGRTVLTVSNAPTTANMNRGLTHLLTPWLRAGPHRVRIFWDNAIWNRTFQLAAIRLQSVQGPDSNNDGVRDWAEKRIRSTCGLEVAPPNSAVSPACVEGRGKYLSMLTLSGEVLPQPTSAGHWYANVPLSQSKAATLICSFESGALRTTNQITWRPTNLLQSGPLTLRVGDALLLDALPEGTTRGQTHFNIEGVTNFSGSAGEPVPHQFNEPGTFKVVSTWASSLSPSVSTTVSVTVATASLGPDPAAWVGKWRHWQCSFSSQVTLDTDPGLTLEPGRVREDGAREHWLAIDEPESRSVVARLGTSGPVVAQAAVHDFKLYSGYETGVRRLETYEDGSELVEMGLILSPMRPELTVRVDLHVGGVVFEDGTITKQLTVTNFDELGQARIRFIRPATAKTSVCHRTRIYQGPILLGTYP